METVKSLLRKLTLQEKVALLVGKDFWHTRGIKRFNLPGIVMSDGPFGLRKVEGGGETLNASFPATCFPTTSALASTWDDDLLKEIAVALASECVDQGVDVLLGPGLNIKRSPLCGRNFEYFSEDPYLSGRLATTLVKTLEELGIGTSVKHFACNNQEEKRLTMNAIIDERALFEIYLKGFEMVIKEAKPSTVMCSYNQVNGLHVSRNPYFLKSILRDRFDYKGLVVSDWGAVVDLGDSIKAGLNLEMPGGSLDSKKLAKNLLKKGVTLTQIDEAITPLLELMIKKKYRKASSLKANYVRNHLLAVRAASEAAVLLKNEDNLLPMYHGKSVALIGAFGKYPRYQGSGSSRINPRHLESVYETFEKKHVPFEYAEGYSLKHGEIVKEKLDEALAIAKNKDYVVVMIGLPDEFEMEGDDRKHLDLPESHNVLVRELLKVNKNVVVVLSAGSAVVMPWVNEVGTILHMHLGGQGAGEALYRLLYAIQIPCGKLTETYPLKLEDVPSYNYFGNQRLNVEYRESIYVGYRYYAKAKKEVQFPFGYGLSYTSYSYRDMEVSDTNLSKKDKIKVSVVVKNIGRYDGKEIVQVYVGPRKENSIASPINLVNYKKVFIKSGKEVRVEFELNKQDFAMYDVDSKTFKVDSGTYKIYIGPHSGALKLSRMVTIESDFIAKDLSEELPNYYQVSDKTFEIPFKQFCALYGQKITHFRVSGKRPFSANNTLNDTTNTRMGRFIVKIISKEIKKLANGDPLNERLMLNTFLDMPIRSFAVFSNGLISRRQVKGIVKLLNLRLFSGLIQLIPRKIKER